MKSGIDPSAVDPNVRPQDDLFAHVNGLWIRATPIPADRGRYGTFDVLRETAEQHVREIIEEVAAGDPQGGTVAAKVGDLYASFMDEDAVEALGAQPLAQDLERAAAVSSPDEVMATSGAFGRAGILGLVMPFVNTDDRDPSRYVVYLEQAGLGLRTVQRLELGAAATQLSGFIRVCRVLGLAENLDLLVPPPVASPIAEMKLAGRQRRRASGKPSASGQANKWTWGETPCRTNSATR